MLWTTLIELKSSPSLWTLASTLSSCLRFLCSLFVVFVLLPVLLGLIARLLMCLLTNPAKIYEIFLLCKSYILLKLLIIQIIQHIPTGHTLPKDFRIQHPFLLHIWHRLHHVLLLFHHSTIVLTFFFYKNKMKKYSFMFIKESS